MRDPVSPPLVNGGGGVPTRRVALTVLGSLGVLALAGIFLSAVPALAAVYVAVVAWVSARAGVRIACLAGALGVGALAPAMVDATGLHAAGALQLILVVVIALTAAWGIDAHRRSDVVAAAPPTPVGAMFRLTTEGIIVDCSRAFARILGASGSPDLVGRPLEEFYDEPGRWAALKTGLQVARDVGNVEVSLKRVDGGVVWVLMNLARVDDGPTRGFEGQVLDISARKRADEVLGETERLRSVATLATAAAHEINNPLNIVKGNLQLLARQVDDRLAADRVAPAVEATRQIEEIVRQMNSIIRLEHADQSSALPEMLDLRRSAEETSTDAAP